MLKLIKLIRLIHLINKLSIKPSDTKRVFQIVDYILSTSSKKRLAKINIKLNTNPNYIEFHKNLQANPDLRNHLNLESLSQLPKNSFGYSIYNYYTINNLNPCYYRIIDNQEPVYLIRNYLARTHDIWHLVSGFGNSSMEEYGLQAFYLGQEASMTAFCIMSAGFIECLKSGKANTIVTYMDSVTRGYTLGKQVKKMIYLDWSKFYDLPFSDVQSSIINYSPPQISQV